MSSINGVCIDAVDGGGDSLSYYVVCMCDLTAVVTSSDVGVDAVCVNGEGSMLTGAVRCVGNEFAAWSSSECGGGGDAFGMALASAVSVEVD